MNLDFLGEIAIDKKVGEKTRMYWDSIAKPLHGLGLLEDIIARIAAVTGNIHPSISKRALVVMCADNGVVEENVTQTGREVTAVVTENFAKGMTSSCVMAKLANCRIVPVDIGVARDVKGDIIRHKIAYGTQNMTKAPAMTRIQTEDAVLFGIELAKKLVGEGVEILATGEMGIGNTTTSAALCSVLLEREPMEITGRGAGLDDAGLCRKIHAIERAIELNKPNKNDPIDVLSKLGGFDIAGLCGIFLGGALSHVPVLADGFISLTAALCAVRLCPSVVDFIFASHASKECAANIILDELKLQPLLYAEMCLGEGTGALAVLPILDMALSVYNEMPTFEQISITPYKSLTPQN